MKTSHKPVRKCYSCPLNLGDHCWLFEQPRDQWRHGRRCPGFENETLYRAFRRWEKLPGVRTGKDLRRAAHRQRTKKPQYPHVGVIQGL